MDAYVSMAARFKAETGTEALDDWYGFERWSERQPDFRAYVDTMNDARRLNERDSAHG
jgi:hypothetical protein